MPYMSLKKALAIFKLKDTILNKLKENNQLDLLNELEIPLSSVLAKMEYKRYFSRSKMNFKKQKKDLSFRIKTLEDKIYLLAGRKFNLNSPETIR